MYRTCGSLLGPSGLRTDFQGRFSHSEGDSGLESAQEKNSDLNYVSVLCGNLFEVGEIIQFYVGLPYYSSHDFIYGITQLHSYTIKTIQIQKDVNFESYQPRAACGCHGMICISSSISLIGPTCGIVIRKCISQCTFNYDMLNLGQYVFNSGSIDYQSHVLQIITQENET